MLNRSSNIRLFSWTQLDTTIYKLVNAPLPAQITSINSEIVFRGISKAFVNLKYFSFKKNVSSVNS